LVPNYGQNTGVIIMQISSNKLFVNANYIWNPIKKETIEPIEKTQRRYTQYVAAPKDLPYSDSLSPQTLLSLLD